MTNRIVVVRSAIGWKSIPGLLKRFTNTDSDSSYCEANKMCSKICSGNSTSRLVAIFKCLNKKK
jgi:hypothetical protein